MSPRRSRPAAPADPPEALRRLGLTPHKALGQHFLIDEFVLGDIADSCLLTAGSTVLEIGAGTGALTEELAKRAGRVVAVEIDEELATIVRQRLSGHPGVCIVAADVLDFTPDELFEECDATPTSYTAVGNLPYYITQPVVRRFLEATPHPDRIVVLVQREVARRIVGGDGRESLLSMSVKVYGEPEALFDVPSTAFWPVPKVQSAVVRIECHREPAIPLPPEGLERFFRLMRAGFSEPRKQLQNTLRSALDVPRDTAASLLRSAEVAPTLRAQHLSLDDWRRLHEAVEAATPGSLDVG